MKRHPGSVELNIGYEAVAAITAVLLLDREGRMLWALCAAALHELGHIVMMRLCGCRLRRIQLRLFDVQLGADPPRSLSADVLITSAGVAVNLIAAAVCLPFHKGLSFANLAIGVFNLLPLESLDGGRLLMLLLERRVGPAAAQRAVAVISFIVLVPFLFLGIMVLLNSRFNYSLLVTALYLLAVLILK